MILILFVAVLVVGFAVMTKAKSDVLPGTSSPLPLSSGERVIVWVLALLNPILTGLIFYYGWKKRLPIKAKQANTITLWAFVIVIAVAVAVNVLRSQS
jgi:hypothetical protein